MNIIESIPQQGGGDSDIPALPNNDGGGTETSPTTNKKKRNKKLALTKHEALTLFWQKGIYVDEATGELRTSTNHKICDKWDLYGYNRHFTFVSIYSCHCHLCVHILFQSHITITCVIDLSQACYKKYEAERLVDEAELTRLKDSKDAFFRMHPQVEEATLFHKKRK